MHLVLTYDIASDTRRTRLHKRLRGFLTPVQKSVFEGDLPDARLPALLDIVRNTISLRKDDVRVYVLCRGCRCSIVLLGTAKAITANDGPIIV